MTATEIIGHTEEFARQRMEAFDSGHDWWHVVRVRNTALAIQSKEQDGDRLVIELAALLHDIADSKFHEEEEGYGGELASRFLLEKGLDQEKTGHIRKIIDHLSFKDRFKDRDGFDSIEFRIVQDADRLDAIGAIGIARAFSYGGFRKRPLYDPNVNVRDYNSAEEYKGSTSPTINHFYEKLFLLRDLMNTQTGRELAQDRHTYIRAFVERFLTEWDGKK